MGESSTHCGGESILSDTFYTYIHKYIHTYNNNNNNSNNNNE